MSFLLTQLVHKPKMYFAVKSTHQGQINGKQISNCRLPMDNNRHKFIIIDI